jgi:hypothetical protein
MEKGELGKRKQQRRYKSLMLLYLHTAAGGVVFCVADTTQGWTSDKNFRNSNIMLGLEFVSEHILNLISCVSRCEYHILFFFLQSVVNMKSIGLNFH